MRALDLDSMETSWCIRMWALTEPNILAVSMCSWKYPASATRPSFEGRLW